MATKKTFNSATEKHCLTCAAHLPKDDEAVYCPTCEIRPVHLGYTDAQLRTAFSRVEPYGNWKNPIRQSFSPPLSGAERALISAAVGFFTGESAKFIEEEHETTVVGRGYYVVIGA